MPPVQTAGRTTTSSPPRGFRTTAFPLFHSHLIVGQHALIDFKRLTTNGCCILLYMSKPIYYQNDRNTLVIINFRYDKDKNYKYIYILFGDGPYELIEIQLFFTLWSVDTHLDCKFGYLHNQLYHLVLFL